MATVTSVWVTREAFFQGRIFRELRFNQRAVAKHQEFGVGMSGQCRRSAGNDDRCADIATHGGQARFEPFEA